MITLPQLRPQVRTGLRLSRAAGHGRPAAPVRVVHLGLGGFVRAHQAWYTDNAPDAAGWGIAAFTGRSRALVEALAPQDGLYTLVTRAPDGERLRVVSSLSAVHGGDEHDAWLGYWADRAVAVATFTVTEAGYVRAAGGGLDTDREDVRADIAALRADRHARVRTAPGRVVAGLRLRRATGAGPMTLLPCDNLPDNGRALERVVLELADLVDPGLAEWIVGHVAFGTTMVDRITPATTDGAREAVRAATGLADAAPVATEPFSEWVVAGDFPAGRPAWDEVGAQLVDDVLPFERRKLWLLNGAHSLLAYAGGALGHRTVADAIADHRVLGWVEAWWDEASRHLALPPDEITAYRRALLDRFANPRIQHLLAQIAADGSEKLPVRVAPVLRAECEAGRLPLGACTTVAAWVLRLRGHGAPVSEARPERVAGLADGSLADAVRAVLGRLAPGMGAHEPLVAAVLDRARTLEALAA
ncbi:mannitol dehydrogenase family protein [Cellulomonas pakistanensis]|uniref:Mannitol-1-phosphate 5-dehydrogenase n=1 Tax=Cellulomonas pakistanensis TaxID=992287 RepID=A0A919P8E0_9CELL|nr:mannitol dehydrogenase family protein [Cellulomonas pakistanensis]GIG36269.1 mannitol dehydrogenase [Cellulomonas pakistanensis]